MVKLVGKKTQTDAENEFVVPALYKNLRQHPLFRNDVFVKILKEAEHKRIVPGRTRAAREWFRNKAKEAMTSSLTFQIQSSPSRKRKGVAIGNMYFAAYDPKMKETLPYYDKFPILIPIEMYGDGFLSMNLHYIPLNLRAKLFDALHTVLTDKRYDEQTQMQISYQILRNAAKFKYFRPCIKRYLYNHFMTPFFRIEAYEWDSAMFMNWANWAKASQARVWANSSNMISRR